MAIRIIKQKVAYGDKPMRVTCPGCRSVVEFTKQDAKLVNDQRDGDYYTIDCPCCPRRITKAVPPCYYA